MQARLISTAWSLIFAAGLLTAVYGLWLAWHPLGFVVGGAALAVIGYGGGLEQAQESIGSAVRKVRQR